MRVLPPQVHGAIGADICDAEVSIYHLVGRVKMGQGVRLLLLVLVLVLVILVAVVSEAGHFGAVLCVANRLFANLAAQNGRRIARR